MVKVSRIVSKEVVNRIQSSMALLDKILARGLPAQRALQSHESETLHFPGVHSTPSHFANVEMSGRMAEQSTLTGCEPNAYENEKIGSANSFRRASVLSAPRTSQSADRNFDTFGSNPVSLLFPQKGGKRGESRHLHHSWREDVTCSAGSAGEDSGYDDVVRQRPISARSEALLGDENKVESNVRRKDSSNPKEELTESERTRSCVRVIYTGSSRETKKSKKRLPGICVRWN